MGVFITHLAILAGLSYAGTRRLTPLASERLLAAGLLAWGNIVVTSLLLAAGHRLGHPAWFLLTSLTLALFTWLGLRALPVAPAEPQPPEPSPERWAIAVFFLAVAPLALANVVIVFAYAPNNYDSLTYHLPRIMFYLGQGSLGHFDTGNDRQIFFPFNYNLLQLSALIHGAPLQFLSGFNLLMWAAAGVAVHRLSRLCLLSANASLISTGLALTSTQILAQATSTTNDLPLGAGLVCTLVFALRWARHRLSRDAILAGLAFGLTVGTKLTVLFFAPPAGLLVLLWAFRHWHSRQFPSFLSGVRAWIAPAALAGLLAAPFALINLGETGRWMTKTYDYTLNRPLSLASAVQTAEGYLAQLVLEPFSRFDYDLAETKRLNTWARQTLFSGWNEDYAFSEFFLFPPDLTEDHVWFGLAGPLILLAAFFCLLRWRHVPVSVTRLAWVGLGWFAVYFLLNRWSLYNQRYMVPAMLLMSPCLGALVQADNLGKMAQRGFRILVIGVALAGLWLAWAYHLQNTRRPLVPFWQDRLAPAALPALPPRLAERLSTEPRVNIHATDGNERIFLLMTSGRQQRFTSFARPVPEAYNIFSLWGFTRKVAYNNIEQFASYTLVPIPAKRTAGVEYLGVIGAGTEAHDYLGLPSRAGETSSSPSNRQALVILHYAPREPNRYLFTNIEVIGLNPADQARIEVGVEFTDRSRETLATFEHDGSSPASIIKPFRRFTIRAIDGSGRQELGAVSIPRIARETPPEYGTPFDPSVIFRDQLVVNDPLTYLTSDGLIPAEGPYPQWHLPLVRWVNSPVVRLTVPANDDLHLLRLSFSLRSYVRERAAICVVHNGTPVKYYKLDDHNAWVDDTLELKPTAGPNTVEFRNIATEVDPDWLGYLEQNPDVKAYVLQQKIPLEQGAREHYVAFGQKEHRTLPMRHTADPVTVPDSRYYLFRGLLLEGRREP